MSISRGGPLLLSAGTDVAFRQRLAQAATAIANIHGNTRSTSPCSSSNEQGPPADVPRCSRQSRRQEHQPHSQWPQGSMALGCQPTIAYGARCSMLLLSQSWRPQRPPWEGINQMRLQHSSGSSGFQFDTQQQQHQQHQQHQHGQHLDEEMLAPPPPASPTALHASAIHDEQFQRELHSLNVAIIANALIFVAKTWVHLITGSSSMLAEALHSVADVLNQILLRIGVLKSLQGPTTQFNYGYLRDRFVWSLISAVGIFFLGAGASVIHGIHSLTDTHQVEGLFWTYLVLGVSGMLEGYSLYVAVKSIRAGAAARKMGFVHYVKSGVDPTTVAVFMEDGGAIVGLLIAAGGTALTHYTGDAMWDAIGSIGIGVLLGGIATFLVSKNRQLLIGRSMNPREVQEIMGLLKRDPVVSYVVDTKTEEIGPRIFRFKAEVAWDGERLASRYLARVGRDQVVERLRMSLRDPDPAAIDRVLKAYGRGIINAVGAEVDRLETEIKSLNPGCHYVDLETDRGRSRPAGAAGDAADLENEHEEWK